MDMEKDRED